MTINHIHEQRREQRLYYTELFQLKVACEYARRYSGSLARWVTWFSALRAIASSGAIAAWAIVKSYPFIWGGIIAAAQVADVLRDVIPLSARHNAVSGLSQGLDALFVEVPYEWEGIYAGRIGEKEIIERRRKLMRLRQELEAKHFPVGKLYLPRRRDLLALAEQDATAYLRSLFESGE